MGIRQFENKIQKSDMPTLERGFVLLCEAEADLEHKLKEIQEAKARFLMEIDIRINRKK